MRRDVRASPFIVATAMVLDFAVLTAFLIVKAQPDVLIVYIALIGLVAVFSAEWVFLRFFASSDHDMGHK